MTIAPSTADNKTLEWSSSDTNLATVTDAGVVTILKDSGTMENAAVSITAKTTDGSDQSAVYMITIEPIPVTAITLSAGVLSLTAGETADLSIAGIAPSNATVQTVSWSSSDTSVATVDSDGRVTVVSENAGVQAVITATADGGNNVTVSCTVTVISEDNKVAVEGVTLSPSAAQQLECGDELTILAYISPEDATTQGVNWYITSGEGTVVTKNSSDSGQINISAVAPGTAVIEARAIGDSTKTASVTITVAAVDQDTEDTPTSVAVTGITVSPTAKELTVGETCKVTATVSPSNATDKTVTWKSSNTAVATVDGSGTITAVSAGEATITATAGSKSATVKITVKAPADTSASDTPVQKAVQTITAKTSYTKVYGCKAFSLGAKTNGDGKLTYTTSNKKIAAVSSAGKVTIKGTGKVTITITAAETTAYQSATLKVSITVKPKKATLKKLASKKKSQLTVTWKKDTNATGYEITVATNKKFTKNKKTVTVKSYKTTSKTIKKLKSNKTYYVKIQSYKTVNGKKVYGAYSEVMKIKVK